MRLKEIQTLPPKEKGVTLIEMLTALSIMSAVMVGVGVLTKQQTDDTKASVTALHLKTIGQAANEYIKKNYTAVMAGATAATPLKIDVATIANAGFLPSGYSATSPSGHRTCVKVLKTAANKLNAMVITEGGKALDDLTLGQVAAQVGAAGGGIYSTQTNALAPTQFRGAMGGWLMAHGNFANGANCGGGGLTPGHPVMALWFADGEDVSATLYRNAVPGNPSLNTMETPLLMGAGTVVTKGNACTSGGAIAKDSTNKLMICRNGSWKPGSGSLTWKGTKANYGDLPASADAGDTWRITGLANHAFTWDDDAKKWEGLAVNADGTFSLLSTIETKSGKLRVVNAGGAVLMEVDSTGIKTKGEVVADGQIRAKGEVVADGRIRAKEYVELGKVVVADSACGAGVAAGTMAKDAQGMILSCQSGAWKKSKAEVDIDSIVDAAAGENACNAQNLGRERLFIRHQSTGSPNKCGSTIFISKRVCTYNPQGFTNKYRYIVKKENAMVNETSCGGGA